MIGSKNVWLLFYRDHIHQIKRLLGFYNKTKDFWVRSLISLLKYKRIKIRNYFIKKKNLIWEGLK